MGLYADKPQTLDHLEDNIRRVIADIRPQMLEKVIENWTSRLDYIRASRASPMPEIIFKIKKLVKLIMGLGKLPIIKLEVDNDDVRKLLDPHNQELTMDELIEMQEQGIEELESLDPVQSQDQMMVLGI
ncbi:hypothetical protein TNCV_3251231 [Trichonephila clavipes]|nr:hypothetical protein TNCV_3251231 [Trichonephila clavipes]